jgi:hypothetical protein
MKPKSEAQDRAQTRRAIYDRQRQAAAEALRALQAQNQQDVRDMAAQAQAQST